LVQEISSLSDEELARQTQAGALEAFEELVGRYEGRIHSFVTQFCRNATDAREVTQDTFVKAFQSLEQFDSRRVFAAWLFTIARRKCIDRHRAAPRFSDETVPELLDDADPAELTARHEDGKNLWRLARRRLGENQFQALWLHYAEDMDVARIAQVLGKSRVHIKVMLFRARQILGRELKNVSQRISPAVANEPPLPNFVRQPFSIPPAKPTKSNKLMI
jgi:RNA polymerase sigma-70 factor (ECF subfamily)